MGEEGKGEGRREKGEGRRREKGEGRREKGDVKERWVEWRMVYFDVSGLAGVGEEER